MLNRRVSLCCEPTPLHPLPRLSREWGVDVWIKRDDLSGFAGGGNKGRKLEFLLADALEQGCDAFVTRGAYQSNFVRQAATACALFGIEFHAAVMHWPYPGPGRETRPPDWQEPTKPTGNALLDQWVGAHIWVFPDGTFETLEEHARSIAERLRGEGKKVYECPGGGSNGIGALGFVRAFQELMEQAEPFDAMVVASGSGGTHGGLAYALKRSGFKTHLIGICTDNEPELVEDILLVAEELDALLLTKVGVTREDIDLRLEYAGKGYQVPTAESRLAIHTLATKEGIFLDPVYTSKAFAGLMDLVARGEVKGRVLFWHTGGFPVLFAKGYEPEEGTAPTQESRP
jgi:D-cysteine desulfhydrase family pyridoxal phosphate-dependent enzyme